MVSVVARVSVKTLGQVDDEVGRLVTKIGILSLHAWLSALRISEIRNEGV